LRPPHCRGGIVWEDFRDENGENRRPGAVRGVVIARISTFSLGKGTDRGKIGSQSRDRPHWRTLQSRGHGLSDVLLLTLGVLACLQLKHFAADYLLQTPWIIAGKGRFDRPGGYVHAGIHAVLSMPALLLAGLDLPKMAALCAAEFVVHFAIDHGKALISRESNKGPTTASFWALHGGDQCIHHLTYLVMTAVAIGWAAA
jgi:hypothetical protein